MPAKLKGLAEVEKALNRKLELIEGKTIKGLVSAALLIKREASLRTPVVTENLRASCFVSSYLFPVGGDNPSFYGAQASQVELSFKKAKEKADSLLRREKPKAGKVDKSPVVAIGYGAFYAAYVHEYPLAGKTGKVGASTVGEWKFLENGIKYQFNYLLEVVVKDAKGAING